MRFARIATVTAVVAMLGGSTASAQTPSERGYDETLGVIGQVDTPAEPPAAPTESAPSQSAPSQAAAPEAAPAAAQPVQAESGSLPFTGLDIGIVALMGVALLGTGYALRRTTNRGTSA